MYWNRLDILAKTGAIILVTDLTPIIEKRYSEKASLLRYNQDVERYNEIIKIFVSKEKYISSQDTTTGRIEIWKIYMKMQHIQMHRVTKLWQKKCMDT